MCNQWPHQFSLSVHFTRIESLRKNKLTEVRKPCTWGLLQTIDSTMEMTYLGSLPLKNIPRWFLNKDTFHKITIEEGIGHIELKKRPPLIHRQRENNTHWVKADHRGECLLIVNLVGLREPIGNLTSFVSMNRPIKIILECKNPFASNNFSVGRWWRITSSHEYKGSKWT